MKKKEIEVFCQVFNKMTESDLYIYGDIGTDNWWSDNISSKMIQRELKRVTSEVLNVFINSDGGDVFESIAIHNLLMDFDGQVHVKIHGLAASGASIIAMAGDTIQMPSNTMMMIHGPWTYGGGDANYFLNLAEKLEKISVAVEASYAKRFIGDGKELSLMMLEDTWLTAAECETLGFCDEILGELEETPSETPKNMILAKYKKSEVTEKELEEPKTTILDFFKEAKQ